MIGSQLKLKNYRESGSLLNLVKLVLSFPLISLFLLISLYLPVFLIVTLSAEYV